MRVIKNEGAICTRRRRRRRAGGKGGVNGQVVGSSKGGRENVIEMGRWAGREEREARWAGRLPQKIYIQKSTYHLPCCLCLPCCICLCCCRRRCRQGFWGRLLGLLLSFVCWGTINKRAWTEACCFVSWSKNAQVTGLE